MQQPPNNPRRPAPRPQGRAPSGAYKAGAHRQQPARQTRQAFMAERRRLQKRKRRISLIVLVCLVVVLLVVALLLIPGIWPAATPASSDAPASSVAVSSTPPVSSAPPPAYQAYTPPAVGNYIEGGIPLLVRRDRPLPDDYEQSLQLASIGGGYEMEATAAAAFLDMQAAAAQDGISLYPVSGWRSNSHQQRNYNNSLESFLAQGYSREEAEAKAQEYYAIPGSSEHEAGLAVDVNSLYTTVENTREFEWLQANCADFGFVMRYHKDSKELTGGIEYEPWHYRYVGSDHARAMAELDMTMDEYVPFLEQEAAAASNA